MGKNYMKKSSHSKGHIHDIAFKIAYYRTPRMILDLLRLFCEDTTLAKLDLDKKQLIWRSDEKRYTSTALWYIMRDNNKVFPKGKTFYTVRESRV